MLTGKEYRASLKDGRSVYIEGKRVTDLENHPVTRVPINVTAEVYDRTYDPTPGAIRKTIQTLRSPEDLREHAKKIVESDTLLELTGASLMTLLTAADRLEGRLPENAARIRAYVKSAQERDIRIVQCITDAKGDRARRPVQQLDRDAYVHVVERRPNGVVLRGAKLHITAASFCHEMMVIPTKAMRPGEEEYSIACMVPVNAPGVKVIDVDYGPRHNDLGRFPVSSRKHNPDAFVIFEDVFVPTERIMLDGYPELAATFAHSLGLWERIGALALIAEVFERHVGFAQLIAEANGTEKIEHIKDKISRMVINATLVRASLEAAITHCGYTTDGSAFPNELYTNAGKFFGAEQFNLMVRDLHDICGGSVQSAPGVFDLENPEVGPLIQKYMATKPPFDGTYRAKLFHAIYDYTAGANGSRMAIAMLLSGGGLHAQRIVARGRFDMERAKRKALATAHLAPAGG